MGGDTYKPTFRYWLPWLPAFVVLAVMFAVWTPPFMYPDEPAHLVGCMERTNPAARESLEKQVLSSMTDHFFWERAGVDFPTNQPDKFYQAPLLRMVPTQFSKPMLYYRISSGILEIAGVQDVLSALFVLRGFSIFLSTITAVFWGLIVIEVFPSSRWQALAMSIMVVPQYVWMAGATNASALAWLSGNLMVLSALWLLRPERRYAGWGLAFTASVFAAVTHQAALPLLSVCVAGVILGRHRIQRHRIPWWVWPIIGTGSACAFFLILIDKPAVVREYGLRITELFFGLRDGGTLPWNISWPARFLSAFLRSAILNFGWMSLEGPDWIYRVYGVILILAAIGWGRLLIHREKPEIMRDGLQAVVLIIGILTMFLASTVGFLMKGSLSQGRYLFPALPAFAVIISAGLSGLIPKAWHRPGIIIIVSLLWTVSFWSLFHVLIKGLYF